MGYLFLSIALIAGTTKGYCGKKTSHYTEQFSDAVLANVIRMTLCVMIGFFIILANGDLPTSFSDGKLLLFSALSGISTAVFVVSWLLSVRQNSYMLLEIFLMLGVLVPLLASMFFLNEEIKLTQWIGMLILFIAVLIMCSYSNGTRKKISPASIVLLLICGGANGVADFSQKLFIKQIPSGSVAFFNFCTYVFAALVLIIVYALTRKSDHRTNKGNLRKMILPIAIMAVCLFVNSFFKTLAAEQLDAIVLYPLNQGCSLILSSLMATFLFKEKLTFKAIIGIVTAFAGLLIINLF